MTTRIRLVSPFCRLSLFSLFAVSSARTQTLTFPLPRTTGDRTSLETTAPFLIPRGITQTRITDRRTLRARGLPSGFDKWDMVTYDDTGRFLFVPTEVGSGAGVFRYDTTSGGLVTLMRGNGTGKRESDPAQFDPADDDFFRLDPATWTSWGSVLTAEETTGGRLFEITNPLASSGFQVKWRSKIPSAAHEGVELDSKGTLYFVDEDDSGSVYKYVPLKQGDLGIGQSFVLRVDAYAADQNADAAADWNATANRSAPRFGAATWVPLTDANGKALTKADPFAFVTTTGGRTAADEVKATPYGKPEDLAVGRLSSGNEVVYCSATRENRVLSIELVSKTKAMVRVFLDFDTVNLATGRDVNPSQNDPYTSPGADSDTNFDDPDNLAIDAFGSIYILEDESPGDMWKCFDANRDGVAESMGLFASLGVRGSEPTGLIAHPKIPYRFAIVIQHPASRNDALWQLDTRPYPGTTMDLQVASGINRSPSYGPGEFVRAAAVHDTLNYEITSPAGSVAGRPFALLAQGLPTQDGPKLLPPGIWLDGRKLLVVLAAGTLPPGGIRLGLTVPDIAGTSLVTQASGIPASGFRTSDASEILFVKSR